MRLSLAQIVGPKRRCLCLNVMNVIWKLRGRKKNTKPVSDYKASVSSVTCVTDIQLFLEIWQFRISNKEIQVVYQATIDLFLLHI